MSLRDWTSAFITKLLAARVATLRGELKADLDAWLKVEVVPELKSELKAELLAELKSELSLEMGAAIRQHIGLRLATESLVARSRLELGQLDDAVPRLAATARLCTDLRGLVRLTAGLPAEVAGVATAENLMCEVLFLRANAAVLKPAFAALSGKRVLYSGQAYYNAWYLSRALRARGWKADLLNWDTNPTTQIYYHGEDFRVGSTGLRSVDECMAFFVSALYGYDIFHFSNAQGLCFGFGLQAVFQQHFGLYSEIELLKALGKKIVYTNNGCLDGVSQTAFSQWGKEPVCSICPWRNEPSICSDERNMAWGKFRNSVADYQCLLGGNRVDYNDDPRVHEAPEFYCLDKEVWHPQIEIAPKFRLPVAPEGTVWLYHAVGHKAERTTGDGVNIKSSHIYLPLIKKLRDQGWLLELLEPTGIPNKELRFLQAQVDVFLDMLTYGWFGANAREAMMLGKPVICYIRPEWLESVREEIPDYAAELPIISATPATVEGILRDLIASPAKRRQIGQRCREFAVRWHSAEVGASRFDDIYSKLLQGDPLLRVTSRSSNG